MKTEDLVKLADPNYHKEIGIETKWRVGTGKVDGKSPIFPYYDADQCREILDSVCGANGWMNEFREVKGHLFAVITIMIDGVPVEKSDAGGPKKVPKDRTSPEEIEEWRAKTAASDSFKRAAGAWGIGRHHDLLPKIYLKSISYNTVETPDGQQLIGPEQLSAYCNATSTAAGYLYWIYQIEKAKFGEGSRGLELLAELKALLS